MKQQGTFIVKYLRKQYVYPGDAYKRFIHRFTAAQLEPPQARLQEKDSLSSG